MIKNSSNLQKREHFEKNYKLYYLIHKVGIGVTEAHKLIQRTRTSLS